MGRRKHTKPAKRFLNLSRHSWIGIFLIGLCFVFLSVIRLHINQPLGGDEPIYILMDYSMVHDHDLNLKNEYQKQSWLTFMPWLSPIPQGNKDIINMQAAKVYSPHGVGIAFFLLPGFFFAAQHGAIILMVLLATLVVWLTWIWTKQITKSRVAAYLAAGSLSICYFFTGLNGFIYPDMMIAALSLATLIILDKYYRSFLFQILLGCVLGFFILVHIKTLIIVGPALLVLTYKLWKDKRPLPWLTYIIVALAMAYFFLTLHAWFGLWNPNQVWGTETTVSFGQHPLTNITVMLFDSYRGLLIFNPITLLVFVGLPIWFKRFRQTLLLTLAVLLPSIILLISFSNFHGGDAPIGRYIVEFLPAFMPALGLVIMCVTRWWHKTIIALLAILTFLVTLDNFITKFPPVDMSKFLTRSQLFAQIDHHTGIALDNIIPTYSHIPTLLGDYGILKVAVCYLLLIAAVVYGFYLNKSYKPLD